MNVNIKRYDGEYDLYCGWDTGLTVYRLLIGCLSVVIGCGSSFYRYKKRYLFWILLSLLLAWVVAIAIDSTALTNGQAICEHRRNDYNYGDYRCDSSIYGVTILCDCLMFLVVLGLWVVLCPSSEVILSSGGEEELEMLALASTTNLH